MAAELELEVLEAGAGGGDLLEASPQGRWTPLADVEERTPGEGGRRGVEHRKERRIRRSHDEPFVDHGQRGRHGTDDRSGVVTRGAQGGDVDERDHGAADLVLRRGVGADLTLVA